MNREKSTISSEQYDVYKENLIAGNLNHSTAPTRAGLLSSSSFPLYGTYIFGAQINYTFTTSIYVTDGILCNVTSTSSTPHYLEVYKEDNQNPSYRIMSTNGIAYCILHSEGYYTIRVRSTQNDSTGTANISISPSNSQYTNVPLCNYEIPYVIPTDQVYNSFLCYHSGTGNPYLDLMSYSSNKIYLARNDLWPPIGSDFDWGLCPRIRTQLSTPAQAALTFTASSLYPTCTADIYLGFPNIIHNYSNYFPDLKAKDAIASAPDDYTYNCIAWAGGDWANWIWYPHIAYYEYNFSNAQAWFDNYYLLRGYTRTGATESNSIIDLWALSNKHTHASVRKYSNSDAIPHGYDWESKLGRSERIYHPRYALECNLHDGCYGSVIAYYIPIPSRSLSGSVYEDVANGLVVIENARFTDEESSIISNKIRTIDMSIAVQFAAKYQRWRKAISHSLYSSSWQITKVDEYKDLYDFCKLHQETKYLVFKLLEDNDQIAQVLTYDLCYESNEALYNKVLSEEKEKTKMNDAIIYRSSYTTTMKFVKLLLAKDSSIKKSNQINKSTPSGLSYSNRNAFNVNCEDKMININFTLSEDAPVSVLIYTLDGVVVDKLVSNQRLTAGRHQYSTTINKSGTYLLVYIKNGTTSVKKVIIN
jgi:hypothetical protein